MPNLRVVVSVTTTPIRIKFLYKTIYNILKQTMLPNAIYLNIPWKSSKGKKYYIPQQLSKLIQKTPSIILNRINKDYGPGTKLFPTLLKEKHPHTRIITIDDDMIYDKKMIETLVNESIKRPQYAIGFEGWNIDDDHYMKDLGSICTGKFVDVIEGFAGALYIRKFFMKKTNYSHKYIDKAKQIIMRVQKAPRVCFFVDDVWISDWLAKNNIKRYLTNKYKFLKTPRSHSQSKGALSQNSKVEERNKQCIDYFIRDFKKNNYIVC